MNKYNKINVMNKYNKIDAMNKYNKKRNTKV